MRTWFSSHLILHTRIKIRIMIHHKTFNFYLISYVKLSYKQSVDLFYQQNFNCLNISLKHLIQSIRERELKFMRLQWYDFVTWFPIRKSEACSERRNLQWVSKIALFKLIGHWLQYGLCCFLIAIELRKVTIFRKFHPLTSFFKIESKFYRMTFILYCYTCCIIKF